MIAVKDLLANVTYSCDFHAVPMGDDERARWWQKVIHSKSSDSGFGHLVDAILENGFDPSWPIGYRPDEGEIYEGHHRIVAAILLGLDEIPYTANGNRWYEGTINAHYDGDDPHPIHLD